MLTEEDPTLSVSQFIDVVNGVLKNAFGDTGRKMVYSTYVDCSSPAAEIPDTRVSILFKKGRFMATITGHVGIRLIVESIDPCD